MVSVTGAVVSDCGARPRVRNRVLRDFGLVLAETRSGSRRRVSTAGLRSR